MTYRANRAAHEQDLAPLRRPRARRLLLTPLLAALTACGPPISVASVDTAYPDRRDPGVVVARAAGQLNASGGATQQVSEKLIERRAVHRTGHHADCARSTPRTASGWDATFDRLGGRFAIGDQSTSFQLPDGRTMWLFGDTIQGNLTKSGGVTNWRMPHSTRSSPRSWWMKGPPRDPVVAL